MRADLDNLDNDLTAMELSLYWLRFLIERELEVETSPPLLPACRRPPRYALAA